MKPRGEVVRRILWALYEFGPMPSTEIYALIGMSKHDCGSILTRMAHDLPTIPKRLHICGYTKDAEGQREYPRPIYALGNRPDAAKPRPLTNKERRERYRAGKAGLVNSVFMLGMPRKERRALCANTPLIKLAA